MAVPAGEDGPATLTEHAGVPVNESGAALSRPGEPPGDVPSTSGLITRPAQSRPRPTVSRP